MSHLNFLFQQETHHIKDTARKNMAQLPGATNTFHNQLLVERSIMLSIQMQFSACYCSCHSLVLQMTQISTETMSEVNFMSVA